MPLIATAHILFLQYVRGGYPVRGTACEPRTTVSSGFPLPAPALVNSINFAREEAKAPAGRRSKVGGPNDVGETTLDLAGRAGRARDWGFVRRDATAGGASAD